MNILLDIDQLVEGVAKENGLKLGTKALIDSQTSTTPKENLKVSDTIELILGPDGSTWLRRKLQ